MVSTVKILPLPPATTTERDTNYTNVPDGSVFFNKTIPTMQITFDTGTNWQDVLSSPEGSLSANRILFTDNSGNIKTAGALAYNETAETITFSGLGFTFFGDGVSPVFHVDNSGTTLLMTTENITLNAIGLDDDSNVTINTYKVEVNASNNTIISSPLIELIGNTRVDLASTTEVEITTPLLEINAAQTLSTGTISTEVAVPTITIEHAARDVSYSASTPAADATGVGTLSVAQTYTNVVANKSEFAFVRGRGSEGTPLSVSSTDQMGDITWNAVNFEGDIFKGASIHAQVVGTVVEHIPTHLVLTSFGTGPSNVGEVIIAPGFVDITGVDEVIVNTNEIDLNAGVINYSGEQIVFDGDTVSASYTPCTTGILRVISNEPSPGVTVGALCVGSLAVDFRVVMTDSTLPTTEPVIGMALTSAAAEGDEFLICTAEIVQVQMDSVSSCILGDAIEKSVNGTDHGRVKQDTLSGNTLGVAAQAASSNDLFMMWRIKER